MLSKRSVSIPALTLGILSLVSCGSLGESTVVQKVVEAGLERCLNDFPALVKEAQNGEITIEKWNQKLNCTHQTLSTFRRFGKGSVRKGFRPKDIHQLISKVLITDQQVSLFWVEHLFKLKAGIFGGNAEILTLEELKSFESLLKQFQEQGHTLIPLIKRFTLEKEFDLYLAIMKTMQENIAELAASLGGEKHLQVSLYSLEVIIDGFFKLSGQEPNQPWARIYVATKHLLMGGSKTAIESTVWPHFLSQLAYPISAYGGWQIADIHLQPTANLQGKILIAAINFIRPFLERGIQWNRGAIPYSSFDHVFAQLQRNGRLRSSSLQSAVRPLVKKLLKSQNLEGMDSASVNQLYGFLNQWERGKTLLDQIALQYHFDPLGESQATWLDRMYIEREKLSATDKNHLDMQISLLQQYRPIFSGQAKQMSFVPIEKYSLNNLSRIFAYHLLSKTLVQSYSANGLLTRQHFEEFFSDFGELFFDLKMVDLTVSDIAYRRFSEAGMFTYASDGDEFIDVHELTYYVAQLTSIKQLVRPMYRLMEIPCSIGGRDPREVLWMNASCFRQQYFANASQLWSQFTALKPYYESLNTERQQDFRNYMERGARRKVTLEDPIGGFDSENFAGILHYVETIADRFDEDKDGRLDNAEHEQAFTVFKNLIRLKAAERGLELSERGAYDVFTYMLKFGALPDSKSAAGLLRYLSWVASGRLGLWELSAERIDVYRVAGNFVVSTGGASPSFSK